MGLQKYRLSNLQDKIESQSKVVEEKTTEETEEEEVKTEHKKRRLNK